jgi:hypothetical protein
MSLTKWIGMPEEPGVENGLNTITEFFIDPCHAPWSVYIKTFFQVTGYMLIFIITPTFQDILIDFARPRTAFGRAHKRTKGRRRSKWRGIPDVSELIAEWLKGQEGLRGKPLTGGLAWMWRFEGVLERVGLTFLFIEVTFDGFYWWCSTVNHSEYCTLQHQSMAEAYTPLVFYVAAGGNYLTVNDWQAEVEQNGQQVVSSGLWLTQGHWHIIVLTNVSNPWSLDSAADCQIFVGATTIASESFSVEAGGTTAVDMEADFHGEGIVSFRTRPHSTLTLDGDEAFYYAIPQGNAS